MRKFFNRFLICLLAFSASLAVFSASNENGKGEDNHRPNKWRVHYDRNACWMSLELVTLEKYKKGEIGANFSVGRMKRYWFNRYTRFLNVGTKDLIILFQFSMLGLKDKSISDAAIAFGERKFKMIKYQTENEYANSFMPIYLLGGETAEKIWDEIKNSNDLSIQFDWGGEEKNIPIEIIGTSTASAMFEACLGV